MHLDVVKQKAFTNGTGNSMEPLHDPFLDSDSEIWKISARCQLLARCRMTSWEEYGKVWDRVMAEPEQR